VSVSFSGSQLVVTGDHSGNNIRVDVTGSGELARQRISYYNGGWVVVGEYGGYSSILMHSGGGNDTVNIDAVLYPGDPITINCDDGRGVVNLHSFPRLAPVNVQNTHSYNALYVIDPLVSTSAALTVNSNSCTLAHSGATYVVNYDPAHLSALNFGLGDAGNTVVVNDTPISISPDGILTTIVTGHGADFVTVKGTTGALDIVGHAASMVRVSNNGRLDGIVGPITILNPPDYTAVIVDDSADPTPLPATVDTIAIGGDSYGRISFWHDLIAPIEFKYGDTSSVTFYTSPGYYVNVLATGVPTTVSCQPGSTVNVGNAGHLTGILGSLTLASAVVNVYDYADPTARTVTLDTVGAYGRISFGGVPIQYQSGGTSLMTLDTGTGGATANVLATSVPTNVAGYGPLTVNVGNAGLLQGIQANLSLSDPGSQGLAVTVNDQNDSADRLSTILDTVNLGVNFIRLRNLAPATIYSVAEQTSQFVVNGGSGQNFWSVEGTAAGVNTAVYGGTGYNQFGAGDGSGNSLLGPLALHGRPGSFSFMEYVDYVSPTAQTYTLTANAISRPGLAPVTFDGMGEVIFVPANVGGNAINLEGVAPGVAVLDTGNGDTLTIGANQTLASILGAVIVGPLYNNTSANVVIDDSANAIPPAGPITFSNDVTYGFSISGLVPTGIYLSAENATYNTNLRTGAGDKTFNMQAAPQGVALTLDAGRGTNTLDYTGFTGNVLVDLPLGSATGFSGISHIQNVQGASGGPAGSYNLLIGTGGNVLSGGFGRRNILVAGASASTLLGGDQDDLLIAGTTAYDTDPTLAAWLQIAAYWAGNDDFGTRADNLASGTGVPLLDASVVTGNGGGNTLIGNGELGVIYTDGLDAISGFDPGSRIYPINP
jgi:hypothetical protein